MVKSFQVKFYVTFIYMYKRIKHAYNKNQPLSHKSARSLKDYITAMVWNRKDNFFRKLWLSCFLQWKLKMYFQVKATDGADHNGAATKLVL